MTTDLSGFSSISSVVYSEHENVQWLMQTRAPDRGPGTSSDGASTEGRYWRYQARTGDRASETLALSFG